VQYINNGKRGIKVCKPKIRIFPITKVSSLLYSQAVKDLGFIEWQEKLRKAQTDFFDQVDEGNGQSGLFQIRSDIIDNVLQGNAEEARYLPLNKETWMQEFGVDNKVVTPIDTVVMRNDQYQKLLRNPDRIEYFGLIKPTLENPLWIIQSSRNSKIYIKSFIDNEKHIRFMSVVVNEYGVETSISNHVADFKTIKKEISKGKLLYTMPSALDSTKSMMDQITLSGGSRTDNINIAQVDEEGNTLSQGKNNPRAMVSFSAKDGRALIQVFEQGDIFSLVHELGHVFRRDLNPADLDVVAKLGGLKHRAELMELQQRYATRFEEAHNEDDIEANYQRN